MTSFSLWKLSNQRRYCDPDPTIIYKYTYMGYIMISSSMACVERRLSWNECNKYHWNIKSSSYLRDSFSAHNLSTSLNGPYIFLSFWLLGIRTSTETWPCPQKPTCQIPIYTTLTMASCNNYWVRRSVYADTGKKINDTNHYNHLISTFFFNSHYFKFH